MKIREYLLKPLLKKADDLAALTHKEHCALAVKVDGVSKALTGGFDAIEARFDTTEEQLNTLNSRLAVMTAELDSTYNEISNAKKELERVQEAAKFYCNMHEYEAAQFAVGKCRADRQFMEKSTNGERVEEAAQWAKAYLAEHGHNGYHIDALHGLIKATWEKS